MEASIENLEIEMQNNSTEKKQLYTVEEVFDHIDKKFIKFYGEFGQKIVKERRLEWNQDDMVNFKML